MLSGASCGGVAGGVGVCAVSLWTDYSGRVALVLPTLQTGTLHPFVPARTADITIHLVCLNRGVLAGSAVYLRRQGSGEHSRLARTGRLLVCFGQC